jgi:hypothetical protein
MSRFWMILSIIAVVSFLFGGTQAGRAQSWQLQPTVQSDVDGMDHSKLNHGVLGPVAVQAGGDSQQVAVSDRDVTGMDHSKLNHGVMGPVAQHSGGDRQQASVYDQDVIGMDHSKLNHGVLGVAGSAAT